MRRSLGENALFVQLREGDANKLVCRGPASERPQLLRGIAARAKSVERRRA